MFALLRLVASFAVVLTVSSTIQAQTLRRLADAGGDVRGYTWPTISADGTVIAATRVSTDGSRRVSVFIPHGTTSDAMVAGDRSFVNQDGSRIFFDSFVIPLAQDGCNRSGIYSIAPDGSGLQRQSLPDPLCSESYIEPRLAEDASRMLYRRGGTAETSNLDGTDPQPLPLTGLSSRDVARIDGAGERVAFSNGFVTGQIAPAGVVEILTDQSNFAWADVSRDGNWLVFQRGLRPDVYFEEQIFMLDTLNGTEEQLTDFPSTRVRNVRISPNGIWVFFFSHLANSGVGPPSSSFFRLNRLSGVIERVSGPIQMAWNEPDVNYDISHDGQQIVFADHVSDTYGAADLLLADLGEPSSIEVARAVQPAVGFPHDPRASTYDVIRGDLTALSFGGEGEVDLGAVLCLADDTPVNGAEDPPGDETPLPGEGFFYLMRVDFGMGPLGRGAETSYGTANPPGARFPSSGDCAIN